LHFAECATDEPTFLRCVTRFTDDVCFYQRRHQAATRANTL
jgi:hypothetical protein